MRHSNNSKSWFPFAASLTLALLFLQVACSRREAAVDPGVGRTRGLLEGEALARALKGAARMKADIMYSRDLTAQEVEEIQTSDWVPQARIRSWLDSSQAKDKCIDFVDELLKIKFGPIGNLNIGTMLARVMIDGQPTWCLPDFPTKEFCGTGVPFQPWWSGQTELIGSIVLNDQAFDTDPDAPGGPVSRTGCRTNGPGAMGPERAGYCYPASMYGTLVAHSFEAVQRDARAACENRWSFLQYLTSQTYRGRVGGLWNELQKAIRHIPVDSPDYDQSVVDRTLDTIRNAMIAGGGDPDRAPVLSVPYPDARVPTSGQLTSLPYVVDANNRRSWYCRTRKKLTGQIPPFEYHDNYEPIISRLEPSDFSPQDVQHVSNPNCAGCHATGGLDPLGLCFTYEPSVGWMRRKLGTCVFPDGSIFRPNYQSGNHIRAWITSFLSTPATRQAFVAHQAKRAVQFFTSEIITRFTPSARARLEASVDGGPRATMEALFLDAETKVIYQGSP